MLLGSTYWILGVIYTGQSDANLAIPEKELLFQQVRVFAWQICISGCDYTSPPGAAFV